MNNNNPNSPVDLTLLRNALRIAMDANPSKNAPYHNNEHMGEVFIIARALWVYCQEDLDIGADWAKAALMISSLLHDWGHSAGKLPDVENVQIARDYAKLFMDEFPINIPDEVKRLVDEAIRCTEFPFVHKPKNRLEEVLRDADLLYASLTCDPKIVMEKLREEMGVRLGHEVSYNAMYDGQIAFFKNAKLFTASGQVMWGCVAQDYMKVLGEYLASKQIKEQE